MLTPTIQVVPNFYTRAEMAEILDFAPSAIDSMVASGRAPKPVTLYGGMRLWPQRAIEDWQAEGCPESWVPL